MTKSKSRSVAEKRGLKRCLRQPLSRYCLC